MEPEGAVGLVEWTKAYWPLFAAGFTGFITGAATFARMTPWKWDDILVAKAKALLKSMKLLKKK